MLRSTCQAAFCGILMLTAWSLSAADPLDDDLDRDLDRPKKKPAAPANAGGDADDLLESTARGTPVRLVSIREPKQPLESHLYWRTLLGAVAAETVPTEFLLDDQVIMATQVGDEPASAEGPAAKLLSTTGFARLEKQSHTLSPGKIPLSVSGGKPVAKHPALKIVETKTGQEIQVLCAPVLFEAVDEKGAPAPQPLDVTSNGKSVFGKPVHVSKLTLWVPVGAGYESTWGRFTLAADGVLQIAQAGLPSGVLATPLGLRKVVPVAAPAVAAAASEYPLLPAQRPFKIYAGLRVEPGAALLFAVDRAAYEKSLRTPFAVEHFGTKPSGGDAVFARPAAAPAEGVATTVAQDLGTTAAKLAWFTLPAKSDLGAHRLAIESRAGNFVHRYVVSAPARGLFLAPPRLRTVFATTESPVFTVLLPGGFAGGEATIVAQERTLGTLSLPAVSAAVKFDSRPFTLDLTSIPAGEYTLQVRCGERATQPVPLQVVSLTPRSPFFLHCMSWGGTWPDSEEGLQTLEEAEMEMVIQGHQLDFAMPRIDESLAAALSEGKDGLPPELCLARTRNDELLQRLLKHRIRHVDFAVTRAHGFYNEGLSYHHSHPPSVERVIRNLQIYTQQVAEYPSFAGVNYSWFPQMYGYVEAGVPTDAWVGERNRILAERLKEAGVEPLTADEQKWYQEHRRDADPEGHKRALALQRRAVDYWKKSYEFGFGRHNKLYNDSVRAIRPDAVNVLYENAGHDSGKRPESLFEDMAAACYFTMTDYGDWPMSAGFTTDWARAQSGKDVWLTTEFLNSTEGETKQLFHAFARGLAGGGLPMSDRYGVAELQRRGKVHRFVSQYGAIARYAAPDRQVALLATNAKHAFQGNGSYDLHAAYNFLTRLGFPPAVVTEDMLSAEKGAVPAETRVLVLVNVNDSIQDAVAASIAAFQRRGGRVVVVGPQVPEINDAIHMPEPLQSIWAVGGPGFMGTAHPWMWKQFAEQRAELSEALTEAEVTPLATVDPEHGYALAQDSGSIRYVTVIADRAGTHVGTFERESELPVSIAGEGWLVRDLRQQIDLPTRTDAGRTLVAVDLSTEPTTILACLREPVSDLRLTLNQTSQDAGTTLNCEVRCGEDVVPRVPIQVRVTSPAGAVWESRFDGSGTGLRLDTLPARLREGCVIECQELLTGLTAALTLGPAADQPRQADSPLAATNETAARPLGDVDRGNLAAGRPDRTILVEPGRAELLPVAQELAAQLNRGGIKTKVVTLRPEDFDTQPNRWIPRSEDLARAEAMEAGKLIGYRQNLAAWIDNLKAVHVPERGGYGTVAPDFDIHQDCIVFSGGMLAESLRVVSSQLDTPSVPGRGQARLVELQSPFHAGRSAVVIVAHDLAGYAAGARELAVVWSGNEAGNTRETSAAEVVGPVERVAFAPAPRGNTAAAAAPSKAAPKSVAVRRPVRRPYDVLTPHQRIEKLLANAAGQAAAVLRDGGGTALLNEAGEVAGAVRNAGFMARLDDRGQLWDLVVERKSEGEQGVTLRSFGTDGQMRLAVPAFAGELSPPGMLAGFLPSPTGQAAALARPGKMFFGPLSADGPPGEWSFYDDAPFAAQRFAVLYPRMPVAAEFSPDGRYLCLSLDTRPPLNNMSGPVFHPTFAETLLIDTQTGQRVWSLRDEAPDRSTYAAHQGFLAVARDAQRTALADYDGNLFVVDAAGRTVASSRVASPDRTVTGRVIPKDGIAVAIADDGLVAAFAFKSRLVICDNDKLREVPVSPATALTITRDGTQVIVATAEGKVTAFDPQGQTLWSRAVAQGPVVLAAVGQNETLAGTGDGEVLRLSAAGEEVRRTEVFLAAKKLARPESGSEESLRLPEPTVYVSPTTLEVAKKRLKAKPAAVWKGSGPEQMAFGKTFRRVDKPVTLTAAEEKECFLHLVYRRPSDNSSLVVTTEGADGKDSKDNKETFELDLPTPSYRVLDLPIRGPQAKVTVTMQGPVEIAECGLWSITWPGPNSALVNVAQSDSPGKAEAKDSGDDLLAELNVAPGATQSGRMKACRLWWPNTDPDRVKGRFLPAPADPFVVVDAKRFGNGKVAPWSSGRSTSWGASLTVEYGKQPAEVSLVATYERAQKQSQVSRNVMVFSGPIKGEHDSPPALATAIGNDQFWRLFDFPPAKVVVLGVHVLSGSESDGLSEVEAYR